MRARSGRGRLYLAVVGMGAAAGALLVGLRAGPAPGIDIRAGLPGIGPRTPLTVTLAEPSRGLSSVKVELLQGDDAHLLAERRHVPRPAWSWRGACVARDELRFDVGTATLAGLREGEAVVRVTAGRAPTWLRRPEPAVRELKLTVRTVPPALELLSRAHYVTQGGSEVVVYRVGPGSVRHGVEAGGRFFPGWPLPGGRPDERFAFFAAPYDLEDAGPIQLLAADDVGLTSRRSFVDRFTPKPLKTDTLALDRAFIDKVVSEIRARTPGLAHSGDALTDYLAVNRDLRRANADELVALARHSAPRFLWQEPFLALPGGQVMAAFADRRTYRFEDREVDRQDHLGFDLASTRGAAVPAANSGVVVLARYFGIYGNAVVLDHGFGLMTLYAHLSACEVKEGQSVARGQLLGRTGQTGLAGGDHLHYSVLLHGLPVNPAEWWDAHWIGDRVRRKLGQAFEVTATTGAGPAGVESPAAPP